MAASSRKRARTAASSGRMLRYRIEVRSENAKLKKLLAEAELDKAMLKEIAAKKW